MILVISLYDVNAPHCLIENVTQKRPCLNLKKQPKSRQTIREYQLPEVNMGLSMREKRNVISLWGVRRDKRNAQPVLCGGRELGLVQGFSGQLLRNGPVFLFFRVHKENPGPVGVQFGWDAVGYQHLPQNFTIPQEIFVLTYVQGGYFPCGIINKVVKNAPRSCVESVVTGSVDLEEFSHVASPFPPFETLAAAASITAMLIRIISGKTM
jgi:hypothetical protein